MPNPLGARLYGASLWNRELRDSFMFGLGAIGLSANLKAMVKTTAFMGFCGHPQLRRGRSDEPRDDGREERPQNP